MQPPEIESLQDEVPPRPLEGFPDTFAGIEVGLQIGDPLPEALALLRGLPLPIPEGGDLTVDSTPGKGSLALLWARGASGVAVMRKGWSRVPDAS